jgi:hypothetical protein
LASQARDDDHREPEGTMMKSSKVLRKMCAGLVAAVLAFGLGASPASAANVLKPMLLTFNDLPGLWAPDTQDCDNIFESLFEGRGAKTTAQVCLDDNDDVGITEVLGLWPTHLAAENAWREWVVEQYEGQPGLNIVNPHHRFPVQVVMAEDTSGGPALASWDVTAVKGRVFIFLFYAVGIRVDPVITIFERALNKISAT